MEDKMEYFPYHVGFSDFSVILISSIFTPLGITFFNSDDLHWSLTELFIDLVFLADIIISFFSAYYNKIEALVSN